MIGKIAIILAVIVVYASIASYINWQVDMEYQRNVGTFFTYADRASDAKTKASYFNQYMTALEKYDLTEGCSSVLYCEQPNAQVKDNYKAAKSLQTRLNELAKLDEKETAYQLGMQQMTENEFCWFPVEPFNQKYLKDHGAWGAAVFPNGAYNSCAD